MYFGRHFYAARYFGPYYWGAASGAGPVTGTDELTRPMIVHGGRTMGWP